MNRDTAGTYRGLDEVFAYYHRAEPTEGVMELVDLAAVDLTYTKFRAVDDGSGGQLYGEMEGELSGERLAGKLQLTNLAPRRPDNVNLPTLWRDHCVPTLWAWTAGS